MRQLLHIAVVALVTLVVTGAAGAFAETQDPLGRVVRAADTPLRQRIADAAPGSVVRLAEGVHKGPILIDKPLTLEGPPEAIVEGNRNSSVIIVNAPDVTVRGITIRGAGSSLFQEDSGVYVTQKGTNALIENTVLDRNLFGVFLKGPRNAVVRNNIIRGRDDLRLNERGNGVHLWNTPGSKVLGNDISDGRDGIFTTTSKRNLFAGNYFHGVRFAVHYMYTNDAVVRDNVSEGNHAGYVMMFSHRIKMLGNVSRGDRDHGFLFNYANQVVMQDNLVTGGSKKCVFIYNAHDNAVRNNWFEGCDLGIHFTAGSERNTVARNAFIGNQSQVKYVGTRDVIWAENGAGNYWSDNAAFDLDGDGYGDRPYRPNGLIDQVVWRAPAARLLLASPAVQILAWAQSNFPAVMPGGVVDPAPLMQPPEVKARQ